MQLVINTGSLSFDTREAIAEVKALGFTAIELNLQQAELAYGFQRQPRLDFYKDLAYSTRHERSDMGLKILVRHNRCGKCQRSRHRLRRYPPGAQSNIGDALFCQCDNLASRGAIVCSSFVF